MRARQRHFNAGRAGAAIVLDARFIAQSDNTAVSQWDDRSGNGKNASQATAANQPTFQVAEMNGNPVVRFDGANPPNADYLDVGALVINQPISFVCACKMNGGADYIFDATSSTSRVTAAMSWNSGAVNGQIAVGTTTALQDSADSRAINMLYGGLFNGSNSQLRKNGTAIVSGNAGTNNMATLRIGERFSNFNNVSQLNGDIGCLIIVGMNNSPLLKRIERAVSYSFKIACS